MSVTELGPGDIFVGKANIVPTMLELISLTEKENIKGKNVGNDYQNITVLYSFLDVCLMFPPFSFLISELSPLPTTKLLHFYFNRYSLGIKCCQAIRHKRQQGFAKHISYNM